MLNVYHRTAAADDKAEGKGHLLKYFDQLLQNTSIRSLAGAASFNGHISFNSYLIPL